MQQPMLSDSVINLYRRHLAGEFGGPDYGSMGILFQMLYKKWRDESDAIDFVISGVVSSGGEKVAGVELASLSVVEEMMTEWKQEVAELYELLCQPWGINDARN